MVKLPDTRQIQRNQPQYTGQVMNVPVGQDAQGMADIAGSVGRLAGVGADYAIQQERLDAKRLKAEQDAIQARQDEIDKFQVFSAKANASNSMKILTATLEKDPEYNKTREKFDAGFKGIREQTIASLPEHIRNDPLKMGYIEKSLQNKYTDNSLKLRDSQYKQQDDTVRASLFETSNQFVQNYAMLDDNERQEATGNLSAMYQSAVGAGIITREQAYKDIYEARTKAERNRLEVLPDEQVMQEYGGKDSNVIKISKSLVLESGGRNLENPNSSAGGFLQWTNSTASQYKVTKGDFDSEINGKEKFDADNAKEFKSAFGRNPSGWEEYMLHQQGGAGGSAIIANPDKNIVDVLSPFYKDKENLRDAIINNGGSVDMTAKEFSDIWRKKYNEADITKLPPDVIKKINIRFGGSQSVLPQGEVIKRLQVANKSVTEKQQKQRVDDIINTVNTQYPDNYEAKVAIVGGLNIPFDERKKIMTILDADKKRQDVIKRDDAEQLSLKAIEWINQGGLFENMPAELSVKFNPSQRTFLQQHSDKVSNKEGMKAEQEQLLEQSELLEYTKVREIISSGDVDKLKTEYPPHKAVALLSPKHYEQYIDAINPKDSAMSKVTQQEENRRINAMFVNIGINDKKNKNNLIDQGLFYSRYYDEKALFVSENGRKPTGAEVQSILNNLTKERVIEKKGSSWKSYLFSGGSEMEFRLQKQQEKKQIRFVRIRDANS